MQRSALARFTGILLAPALWCAPTLAQATFQGLGSPESFPNGISSDGNTLTGSYSYGGAWIWTAATGQVTVPGSTGYLAYCSDDGKVLSGSVVQGGLDQAARWTSSTGWTGLGGIGGVSGNQLSTAFHVNGDGSVIVGLAWYDAGSVHAFRWTQATGMVDLGSTGSSSRANAVSADGATVVGWDQGSWGQWRPSIWKNGVQTLIGSLDPSDPVDGPGECWAASPDGSTVVGESINQAFRWTAATGVVGLGTLHPNELSLAADCSADGSVVVGRSGHNGPYPRQRAFLWRADLGMVDLHDFLASQGAPVSNWILYSAQRVSADGTFIAGYGRDLTTNIEQGWIARLPTGGASTYCTAKVNSLGCTPRIAASGTPSVSQRFGFYVSATAELNAKTGQFVYGTTGQQSVPFQGGTLCVAPPLKRTQLLAAAGNPPSVNDCSGTYVIDFNQFVAEGGDPSLVAGATVDGQFWARDPGFAAPNNVSLTDAIHFTIQP